MRSGCAGSLRECADIRGGGSGVRTGCDSSVGRWSSGWSGCDGILRKRAGSGSGRSSGRSAVFGDHVQLGDGKAVVSSGGTRPGRSVPDEGYVMAQMWLEINTARGELENAAGVVFHNCVVPIRATQATPNCGLVCIDARRGSLCKPQRDQQGRCDDQQECSFHGILRRFSPCGGPKFRLGFDSASDSSVEPSGLSGSGVRTWSIQVKPHNLIRQGSDCLLQTAHI